MDRTDRGLRGVVGAQVRDLGTRLSRVRLSRNVAQADLAKEAGISISTLKRLEAGENTSLEAFIRVLLALRLGDHLSALLPDPAVRPVERVRMRGRERQRASGRREPIPASQWAWGDGGLDQQEE